MKVTFKQFIAEDITAYHSTTGQGLSGIELHGFKPQSNQHRLFPHTVSFTYRPNEYGGNVLIKARLKFDEDDVLRLNMRKLWSITRDDEEVTPLELGKRWVKRAQKEGKKVIIMTGVPGVGTEIAVLDVDVIRSTERIDNK